MSSPSAETAIPEEPTGVESSAAAEGENERESALPADNNTASAAEPGTPDCPEGGTGAGEVNEAKDDGDVAARASPVEGLLMNGSAAGNGEASAAEQEPKTLENADTLFQKGCDALKAEDLVDAVDFLSQSLEIRVSHFGELAPECATTYYKYGCALLYKAQDEADPFNESAALAKKAESSSKNAIEETSGKAGEGEPSEIPVTEVPIRDDKGKASVSDQDVVESMDEGKKDKEEGAEGEASDEEDAGEDVDVEGEDEEDSDLDLAWKMLESARVILDKQEDTIEKVEVISALGDVSLEREDFQTSSSDYLRALSILERLEEPNSRHISQLCFKICLALQMQNKISDALNYCQRALSICTSRMQRLTNEAETSKGESVVKDAQTNNASEGDLQNGSTSATEDEVNVLKGLMSDLSDKIEDLKAMMSAPPLFEVLQSIYEDKSISQDKNAFLSGNSQEVASTESSGFDQPRLPTAPSSGSVTHLGVVGRGVKRAAPVPIDVSEEPATKKLPIGSNSAE